MEGQRVGLEALQAVLPHVEGGVLLWGEALTVAVADGSLQVLALDVERAHLPTVGQADRASAGDVVADLADGADRVLEGQVAHHRRGVLEHAQHDARGSDLEKGGVLAHVRVAHDDVQPAVLLGVGMGLVAGVDDRPTAGRGRGDALPDVLGALAQAEDGPPGRLEHLAGAGIDLAASRGKG